MSDSPNHRIDGPGTVRADVIVVGSGPNGLAAALTCARAGRDVVVLEAGDVPGGGCRTLPLARIADHLPPEVTDGLRVDPCSAVHPMAGASPFFREFDLAAHGVDLLTPPVQVAHALPGRDAIVVPSPGSARDDLATGLGSHDEARRWSDLMDPLSRRVDDVVAASLSDQRSVPPVRATTALARALLRAHPRGFGSDPLGPDGRTLLAGISAHAITPLTSPAATAVGLVLATLLDAPHGWAVPRGGSGALTTALADAVRDAGGEIRTGVPVSRLDGLHAPDIVFNTSSHVLAEILLASSPAPAVAARARRLLRAPMGGAAAKVDLVLSGPVPWRDPRLAGAGTIHLGGDASAIATAEGAVAAGRHADSPVVLVSQPWVTDPDRITADGRRPLWTYAHVPAHSDRNVTEQVLTALESVAPGIRDVVLAAHCTPASRMGRTNPNFGGGDIASGRVDLRGLLARPVPRPDPFATGLPGIWQASGSTTPGPGVHGMAGKYVAERILGGGRHW